MTTRHPAGPRRARAVAVAAPARTRLTASTLVALLVAALLSAAVASAPPARASAGTFVSLINSARAGAGLPPLASRGDLASVAAAWSRQMADSGNLAHNPRLASQVSGYRFVGENVGYGPDAGTIHRAFMASSSHRANILDRDYTEVGVAVVEAGGRLWVTEVFRAPTGSRPGGSSGSGGSGGSSAGSGSGTSGSGGSTGPSTRGTRGSTSSGRGTAAAPPPPPPPSPEELLRRRAVAAVAGPGAQRADDPVQQALRFAAVMRATSG